MATPSTKLAPADNVKTGTTVPNIEDEAASTEDSTSDSESSGSTGSSNSESTNSGSIDANDRKRADVDTGVKAIVSDGIESGEVISSANDDNESVESYKSLNTTLKLSNDKSVVAESNAPESTVAMGKVVSSSDRTANIGKFRHPSTAAKPLKTVDLDSTSSPVPVTPAKSVIIDDLCSAELSDKLMSATPAGATRASSSQVFSTPRMEPVAIDFGDLKLPTTGPTTPATEAEAVASSDVTRKLLASSNGKDLLDSPTRKQRKKNKSKSKKLVEKKVEEVVEEVVETAETVDEEVRRLQAELDQIRRDKLKAKLEAKKRKLVEQTRAKKSKKAKKRKPTSSNEAGSTTSSSSDEPTTSSRISKIPEGRSYQRIAMSRSKQLGLIKPCGTQRSEIIEAIKIIDTTEFKIVPVHAYPMFRRVPGSNLPHIRKATKDICNRYGILVRSIAKLHLFLARDQFLGKDKLVIPVEVNSFTPIWLFNNDLSRASDKPEMASGSVDDKDSKSAVKSEQLSLMSGMASTSSEVVESAQTVGSVTPKQRSAVKDKSERKKKSRHESEVIYLVFRFAYIHQYIES